MTNTLPAGVTYTSTTPNQGTAACAADVITCDMRRIEASGVVHVSIVVQENASVGDLSTIASVSAAQTDANGANNTLSIPISMTGLFFYLRFLMTMITASLLSPLPEDNKFF